MQNIESGQIAQKKPPPFLGRRLVCLYKSHRSSFVETHRAGICAVPRTKMYRFVSGSHQK